MLNENNDHGEELLFDDDNDHDDDSLALGGFFNFIRQRLTLSLSQY